MFDWYRLCNCSMPKGNTPLFWHDLPIIIKAMKKEMRLELTKNCEFE